MSIKENFEQLRILAGEIYGMIEVAKQMDKRLGYWVIEDRLNPPPNKNGYFRGFHPITGAREEMWEISLRHPGIGRRLLTTVEAALCYGNGGRRISMVHLDQLHEDQFEGIVLSSFNMSVYTSGIRIHPIYSNRYQLNIEFDEKILLDVYLSFDREGDINRNVILKVIPMGKTA